MNDLILASNSSVRRRMLENAGFNFQVHPADLDEARLKVEFQKNNLQMEKLPGWLAVRKAQSVSQYYPSDFVIGADQILDLDGQLLNKPGNIAKLKVQLGQLSGRWHRLISAACLVKQGQVIWQGYQVVNLHMKNLTEKQIDQYIEAAGRDVIHSVGGYHYEGLGVRLFEHVEGDYFAILGLPLKPLITALDDQPDLACTVGFTRQKGA